MRVSLPHASQNRGAGRAEQEQGERGATRGNRGGGGEPVGLKGQRGGGISGYRLMKGRGATRGEESIGLKEHTILEQKTS